jgi:hypothetical protein
MHPANRNARVAGALYLLSAVIGFFSILYGPGMIVAGNATATASNILAHETLFRLGLAAGLISAVIFILVVMALYRLLSGVDKRHASLMVALVLVAAGVGFVDVLNSIAALALFHGADFLAVFDKPQRDALGMLFLGGHRQGVDQIFWGLWLLPLGVLVMRSRFLPWILGVWLIISGFAYLTVGFTGLLLPEYAKMVSRIAFPALLGELAFMLWLLIVGAKAGPLANSASASAGGSSSLG